VVVILFAFTKNDNKQSQNRIRVEFFRIFFTLPRIYKFWTLPRVLVPGGGSQFEGDPRPSSRLGHDVAVRQHVPRLPSRNAPSVSAKRILIQGTFKEHSRNIQGTFKEHSDLALGKSAVEVEKDHGGDERRLCCHPFSLCQQ
jgi:hypothetical protein